MPNIGGGGAAKRDERRLNGGGECFFVRGDTEGRKWEKGCEKKKKTKE